MHKKHVYTISEKMKILKFEDKTIVLHGPMVLVFHGIVKRSTGLYIERHKSDEPDNTIFVTGDVDEILNSNTLRIFESDTVQYYEQYPLHHFLFFCANSTPPLILNIFASNLPTRVIPSIQSLIGARSSAFYFIY